MKTAFRTSFERDLRKLKNDPRMLDRVRRLIEEVETADGQQEIAICRS